MKDSNFYELVLHTNGTTHINDSVIVSKEEVYFIEFIHKLKLLGDYLRYSYYIPMDSGYNIKDVIRSPMPPTTKKKKK